MPSTLQIQSQHSLLQTSHHKMAQVLATEASKMCVECGCEAFGSSTGMTPIEIKDRTMQGAGGNMEETGVTLSMTATNEQRLRFINE